MSQKGNCRPGATTVLVVCPSNRDRRELAKLQETRGYRFLFHDYASIELEEMVAPSPRCTVVEAVAVQVERMVAAACRAGIDAVVSTDDYPGSTLAAIVAGRLGLPGTPIVADLLCQHKYHSRLMQQISAPEVVPPFTWLEPGTVPEFAFPFFIKPVKSFFSVGACRVEDAEMLSYLMSRATLPEAFFEPFDGLLQRYAGLAAGPSRVMAEGLLSGSQATFEGYAFDGRVSPVAVVDSIMFPGTLSFQRFEYPSALPQAVQDRMADVAARVMAAMGFTHGLFNIEFCYDSRKDRLGIVEINPRMATQFADLYEKVDGFNTYELLLDLALDRRPSLRHRQGRHAAAASCVLRRFEDAQVVSCPSQADVQSVLRAHPDARIEVLGQAGEYLSRQMQDGSSFRYGLINVGGATRADVVAIFDWCRQRLPFQFELRRDSGLGADSIANASVSLSKAQRIGDHRR